MSTIVRRSRRRRRTVQTQRRPARDLAPISPCKACQSPGEVKGATTRFVECSNEFCAATGPQCAGDMEAIGLWNLVMAPCGCEARIVAAEQERDQFKSELQNLVSAYVRLLEAGRDRILSLGGDCEPVDRMEEGDPALRRARAALRGNDKNTPAPSAAPHTRQFWQRQHVATWGKPKDLEDG